MTKYLQRRLLLTALIAMAMVGCTKPPPDQVSEAAAKDKPWVEEGVQIDTIAHKPKQDEYALQVVRYYDPVSKVVCYSYIGHSSNPSGNGWSCVPAPARISHGSD